MNTGTVLDSVKRTGLKVEVQVPTQLDASTASHCRQASQTNAELSEPLDALPSLTCKLLLSATDSAHRVRVSVSATEPFEAKPASTSYALVGGVPLELDVTFSARSRHVPSSLKVNVCAVYSAHSAASGADGATRVAYTSFRLPLRLAFKCGSQQQQYKIDEQRQAESGGGDGATPKSQTALSTNLKKVVGSREVLRPVNSHIVTWKRTCGRIKPLTWTYKTRNFNFFFLVLNAPKKRTVKCWGKNVYSVKTLVDIQCCYADC